MARSPFYSTFSKNVTTAAALMIMLVMISSFGQALFLFGYLAASFVELTFLPMDWGVWRLVTAVFFVLGTIIGLPFAAGIRRQHVLVRPPKEKQ